MPDGYFADLGIKLQDFVGGLAGGTASAVGLTRSNFYSVISSMIVGALTASYLTDTAVHYIGTGDKPTAFLVGVGGMAICQGVGNAAKTWFPFTRQQQPRNPDA